MVDGLWCTQELTTLQGRLSDAEKEVSALNTRSFAAEDAKSKLETEKEQLTATVAALTAVSVVQGLGME